MGSNILVLSHFVHLVEFIHSKPNMQNNIITKKLKK